MDIEKVKKTILAGIEIDPETWCWNWVKALTTNGYGVLTVDKIQYRAHRLSYSVFIDEIPDGLEICHKCDNHRCCNPDHLFIGTHRENMADMVKKGRQRSIYGSEHCGSKITEADALQIRELSESGIPGYRIAELYNISKSNVSMIINRHTWKHI